VITWDGTGQKTRLKVPCTSIFSICRGWDFWRLLQALQGRSSGPATGSRAAALDTCWRSAEASPSRCDSNTRQRTETREAATIGFRSLPRLATTAESASGSFALAGRMVSPAGAVAGSCIYPPVDTFLRAECATNSLTKVHKNRAAFSMN
jgi:hypothetical protein